MIEMSSALLYLVLVLRGLGSLTEWAPGGDPPPNLLLVKEPIRPPVT